MRLKRADLPPVYAITDIPGDGDYAALAASLAAAGLRWIQIRIKSLSDTDTFRQVNQAVLSAPGATIIINDRTDFAVAAHASGVHLGESDLPPHAARRVPGSAEIILGFSTHDAQAALRAAGNESVDYVAIGPIFRSPTKNVREPLGLEILRKIRPSIEKPIVAIGGIDASNIASVLRAGADSAAVISALDQNGDLCAAADRLMKAIEEGR
ncbi:MAG: thiamine phosphate synthase [Acidobacteriota bacterium]